MIYNAVLNIIRTGISKNVFLVKTFGGCVAFIFLLSVGEARATNILTNAGFELGSLADWSTYGANNYILSGASTAHGGTYSYKVYGQFIGATNYTGIYQDIPSAPGDTYSADGWAYSLSSDAINGQDSVWLEVTFLDSSKSALTDYRSDVVNSANIAGVGGFSTWFDLQITNQCSFTNPSKLTLLPGTVINTVANLVAPAGTAYVRYNVVFEQGSDNANGSVYFDDLTLNQTSGTIPETPQWNIVWDDEFNGTSIDTTKWTFDLGNDCPNNCNWGNHELEYYTSSTNNAYVDGDGLLHIVALEQSINGYSFTSARMKTEGLYNTPTYGRIQWRAAMPTGLGMWPALWMLGSDIDSGTGWPACGEIDVVENNGNSAADNVSSLHYGTSGEVSKSGQYNFPSGQSITNFHIYELDWTASSIQFYCDGNLYETQSSGSPFNAPFFFIMNLAVGGDYPGDPSVSDIEAANTFPQQVLVDYVRVYELTAPLQISTTQTNGNFVLSWPTNIVCHLQAQTNSLTDGNWSDLSNTTNPFVVSPNPSEAGVFYRLESP
jgi:beta-glucanase (GH16 family)